MTNLERALVRLEAAAKVFGDLIDNGIDPDWDVCQELEAAAIAYRRAVLADEQQAEGK